MSPVPVSLPALVLKLTSFLILVIRKLLVCLEAVFVHHGKVRDRLAVISCVDRRERVSRTGIFTCASPLVDVFPDPSH